MLDVCGHHMLHNYWCKVLQTLSCLTSKIIAGFYWMSSLLRDALIAPVSAVPLSLPFAALHPWLHPPSLFSLMIRIFSSISSLIVYKFPHVLIFHTLYYALTCSFHIIIHWLNMFTWRRCAGLLPIEAVLEPWISRPALHHQSAFCPPIRPCTISPRGV